MRSNIDANIVKASKVSLGRVFCDKINDVSSTELDQLKGSKKNIQEQLNILEQKKINFAETSSVIKNDLRQSINEQLGSSLITEETPIDEYAAGVRSIEKGITTQNTKDTSGYVLAGGANTNRVWATDENGNPGWRHPDHGSNGKPVIATLTSVNQLNGLIHSHYKVSAIDTNYAKTIGITDNTGDFYVDILNYNGSGSDFVYGTFILSSPRLLTSFYLVNVWNRAVKSQKIVTKEEIVALNNVSYCEYTSFDAIPFDGKFRTGKVQYDNGDSSSPLPDRRGDTWFNFMSWGPSNRRTYVAWSIFQDYDCIWYKIQHDSSVRGWYKVSANEIATLKTDVSNLKTKFASFETAKTTLVNSNLGKIMGFTNSMKMDSMIASLCSNSSLAGVGQKARNLYDWLVAKAPDVKVITRIHPIRKFAYEHVEIQNKIKTLASSDVVTDSMTSASFVKDYAYLDSLALSSVNIGVDYPQYSHSAAANSSDVIADVVICESVASSSRVAGVSLTLSSCNMEPCVFVIGVRGAVCWNNSNMARRAYNFLIVAL